MSSTDPPPSRAEPLDRVGPYELLEELGRGGMGVVYLARRADGQFEMEVAVKLVDPGKQSEELLHQFERERRILSHLKHPGIARLIDEGIAVDGRPYLVMEYVAGLPIDRWCDRERLSIRERLELFGSVCEAIDSAHQSLVVHRDLKPSNILIDERGRPKLLDFGIAKRLDPAPAGGSEDQTQASSVRWTPSYASPEQVRGEPITTASDTYSAGVVLYQILTGRVPLSLEGLSPAQAERMLGEVQPLAPSVAITQPAKLRDEDGETVQCSAEEICALRRGSPKELAGELAGDLDTVVLKALHKGPARRYPTPAGLAEDLRRFSAGLPVSARPDTVGYRTGKFIRRNRTLVSAGLLVFLSLVTGLVLSTRQYRRASRARIVLAQQVEQDRQRSRQLEERTDQLELSRREVEEQRLLAEDRAVELERRTEALATEKDLAEAERSRAAEILTEVRARNLELERQRGIAHRRYDNTREFTHALVFDVWQAIAPLDAAGLARQIVVRESMRYLERLAASEEADIPLLREVSEGYRQLAEAEEIPLAVRLDTAARARKTLLLAIERVEGEEATATTEETLESLEEELERVRGLVAALEAETQAAEEGD